MAHETQRQGCAAKRKRWGFRSESPSLSEPPISRVLVVLHERRSGAQDDPRAVSVRRSAEDRTRPPHARIGRRRRNGVEMIETEARSPGTNWAGNYRYRAERLHRPTSLDSCRTIVAGAPRVHVLGSRHSFNAIADAAELISLEALHSEEALPAGVEVDHGARTVSFGAGMKYGELVERLDDEGLALHNLASLPHISVAGAVATATHGSGVGNGNLATAVAALRAGDLRRGAAERVARRRRLRRRGGRARRAGRRHPPDPRRAAGLRGPPAGVRGPALGRALRALRRDRLARLQRQRLHALGGRDRPGVGQEPDRRARPTDATSSARAPATVDRHAILGLDPTPCTPQLGRPGPWSDRLPHFRMGFTPSAGEELQSEYLLPRRTPSRRSRQCARLAERIRPLLLVCEIRTIAADRLWMSTQLRAGLGRRSTSRGGRDAGGGRAGARGPRGGAGPVRGAAALGQGLPRGRRGHRAALRAPCRTSSRLVERLDPRGAFRNAWLEDARARRQVGARPRLAGMIERRRSARPVTTPAALIFGAAALGEVSQGGRGSRARVLLEHGINHIDVAASYGDAELRIAAVAAAPPRHVLRRDEDRRADLPRRRARRSAVARPPRRRPGRLIQLHNLVDVIEWDTALAPAARSRRRSRRARRAWSASSASPATGCPCPRCTAAASSASPSTRCCCPYNYVQMQDAALRARRSRRCRRLRRAQRRAADDQEPRPRAAGTAATPRPRRPGTSRCASRPTSTSPCTGCSAARRRSCSPPATSRSCRACSTPPSASSAGRSDEQMNALAARAAAEPLFV